ncbi:MAG: hypothetical protein NTU78_17350 [Alphaproteobacteria bacterium]|nr:hypothetical protein [Alphaproteobacteria bacterium]
MIELLLAAAIVSAGDTRVFDVVPLNSPAEVVAPDDDPLWVDHIEVVDLPPMMEGKYLRPDDDLCHGPIKWGLPIEPILQTFPDPKTCKGNKQ